MLVTFSGLDGSGKTTQIELLRANMTRQGYRVRVLTMCEHIHVSATVRRWLRRLLRRDAATASADAWDPVEEAAAGSPTFLKPLLVPLYKGRTDSRSVLLRQAAYLIDLCRFVLVQSYYQYVRREILIMDRYFFDSLATVADPRGWRALYTRCFLALAPQPDLAIFLDVDARTAFARKPEFPLEYGLQRRERYARIFRWVRGALVVSSEEGVDKVHQLIMERTQSLLSRSGRASKPDVSQLNTAQ